jgi:hypothetical protein
VSKKELRKYLHSLEKEQVEEQLLDLYERFKVVKVYYNFVFNPSEDKLLEECKFKIEKEYFPPGRRKPKARRSVAQKFIRHFIQLGVDRELIAEVMLFNLETAQRYSAEKIIRQEAFFISMLKSYREARDYIRSQALGPSFQSRLRAIAEKAWEQDWFNRMAFELPEGEA